MDRLSSRRRNGGCFGWVCHERRVETGDTPHELLIDRFLSLEELEVVYLYLDAIALRVRTAGKVVSSPVLVAVAVLADGQKQLLSLEMCGSESNEAWKGFLDDLVARKLAAPRALRHRRQRRASPRGTG